MTDDVETATTPDDARRAALLARIQSQNAPSAPSNPWAQALGWIGGVLLALGVILLIVDANQTFSSGSSDLLVAGVIIAGFGLTSLLLLFTAKAVTWRPQPDAEK